ncbi:hypothetical protein BDK51DRAFT_28478 [Blyttiomyces helicus]|uniref:Uncharacterized protein n=1 Tax=Blyttiomyces helicus TaxID=388810 RepID=A0A4P9WQ28_9FUNG|nr:hypothetical protein BDK51DRAFT_28478 [Blyttiomyces helicus]|eukprot:RKO92956.1 hypothetical protein BDK51DRAFT_28478 [Blyttiomyces helicus]
MSGYHTNLGEETSLLLVSNHHDDACRARDAACARFKVLGARAFRKRTSGWISTSRGPATLSAVGVQEWGRTQSVGINYSPKEKEDQGTRVLRASIGTRTMLDASKLSPRIGSLPSLASSSQPTSSFKANIKFQGRLGARSSRISLPQEPVAHQYQEFFHPPRWKGKS